jgi:hypothetical protein
MSTYAKISHAILTGKRFNDLLAHHADVALDAWAVWSFCQVVSTRDLSDGRVYRHQLATLSKPERVASAVDALCSVGLVECDGEHVIVLLDFAEHNSTKAEVEALRTRRSDAGRAGGKSAKPKATKQMLSKHQANASGLLDVCLDSAEAKAKPPVSVSASASVVGSDLDHGAEPDLGLLPTAPTSAKVRGALARGYRDAFVAAFGSMPGDVKASEADGAVFAIEHRAGVTGQDPVAIAVHAARNWLESRDPWDGNPRKLPRWKYFLSDIGAVLTQVPMAEAAQ